MATDTSILQDRPKVEGQRKDAQGVSKGGLNVGVAVLWIVAATALWNVVLVLLHYLTDRLLGR
ncbi:MAG TPA: hypothetical protein VFB23_01160 [Candidatus Acidoferrales bacterium]|jgi:hypothetical protein|nr:hypothetical protein [Candidatus Acidoferrales bacterium]